MEKSVPLIFFSTRTLKSDLEKEKPKIWQVIFRIGLLQFLFLYTSRLGENDITMPFFFP